MDNVEKAIREKLENMTGYADKSTQAFKLSMHFKKYDTDRSGQLSKVEFEKAMVDMNFVGCQKEVKQLYERYDVDSSGSLSYKEFVEEVVGLKPSVKGDPFSRSVLERLRVRITERGGMNGIRTLGVLFRIMDDNGSNSLTYDEFHKGMNDIGVPLNKKDFTQLCKIFDRNGDGQISFDEFLRGIRGKMSTSRQHFVHLAFATLDKDESGSVSLKELAEIYDCSQAKEVLSGAKSEDELLREFSEMWDDQTAPDGNITLEEFMNYYKDVSASIDSDEYFELMMRNAWHISGGQGQSANTSCLRICVTHDDKTQEIVELTDDIGLSHDNASLMKKLEEQGVKNIFDISLSM